MRFSFGEFNRPAFGHRISGDGTFTAESEQGAFAAIIDGLGHGPEAAESARCCIEILVDRWSSNVEGLATRMHKSLQGLRGAAAGLLHICRKTGKLHYVGNTTARCWPENGISEKRLISRDGVLGGNLRKATTQELAISPPATILLYTDGVSSHFRAEDCPGLLRDQPRIVARRIVRDFGKKFDDAACVVLRCEA